MQDSLPNGLGLDPGLALLNPLRMLECLTLTLCFFTLSHELTFWSDQLGFHEQFSSHIYLLNCLLKGNHACCVDGFRIERPFWAIPLMTCSFLFGLVFRLFLLLLFAILVQANLRSISTNVKRRRRCKVAYSVNKAELTQN